MIDSWVTFWTWVLIVTAILYSCLGIVVAIGGFFDIRTLLQTMDRQHKDTEEQGSDENQE